MRLWPHARATDSATSRQQWLGKRAEAITRPGRNQASRVRRSAVGQQRHRWLRDLFRVLLGAVGQWPLDHKVTPFGVFMRVFVTMTVLVSIGVGCSAVWALTTQQSTFPTQSNLVSPTPTAPPPAARFDRITFVCLGEPSGDYMTIDFHAQRAPLGAGWWVLVLPVGGPTPPRYFSSRVPMSDGEEGFHTRVYIGPANRYEMYLALAPTDADDSIRQYISAREIDGRWALGMPWPQTASFRAGEVHDRTCSPG